ncbi:DNA modification methylase [Aureliella helgolandensis]|uniref:Methyltransferase n=1 Tax=Aureliella helgolandensis TaxID=2527968 RepID=A0A518GBE9_9BACT|nr:DNA modification methylase [Aureliella helgolandensis]QDV25951.1 putative methyltransferase [Aureliella helgolandensis]
MKIEMWTLSKLKPYPGNPRINKHAVEAVATSLREYGFRQPIVVDAEGVVVCGHTRLQAAHKLGLDKVPVHIATDLTQEQVRAYRIADNQTATIADWNMDLLPLELCGLRDDGYDLGLLGFDAEELDRIMGGEVQDGECDPDDVPLPPEEPVTRPGDLWVLGKHRLLCGDSTKPEDLARLMDGQQADLWLTDPPYNVDYTGRTKDALKVANDSMAGQEFKAFLLGAFTNAFNVSKPGAAFYIWHADSEGYTFRGAVHECGQRVRQCLIWNKNIMVMGRQDYHWQHEPCLYGWKDGASHGWYSDRKQTTVLNFDRPSRSEQHPTMKPVALFAYLIVNSSARGSKVLDTFAGSGTTLLACEQTGRQAFLMELDPIYCDVIVDRYQRFSGKPAVLQRTGDSPIPMESSVQASR